MEVEVLIRTAALVLAVGIILSNVDYSGFFSRISTWWNTKKVVVDESIVQEVDFLEIVDLWYKLKDKCSDAKLEQAVEKLDEVFPLLNEDENDV
jgi:hypothetical protein